MNRRFRGDSDINPNPFPRGTIHLNDHINRGMGTNSERKPSKMRTQIKLAKRLPFKTWEK